MKYHVGCCGWRTGNWAKSFYPDSLDARDYLAYYSKAFDFVEVNIVGRSGSGGGSSPFSSALQQQQRPSSFGKLASNNNNHHQSLKLAIRKWAKQTPDDFCFTVRLPQNFSWRSDNGNNSSIGNFLEELAPLEEKILSVVMPAPPLLTLANGGREWLEQILDKCTYHGYYLSIQFSHISWFQDLTYNILKRHNASLAWSDIPRPFPVVTADFIYLRLHDGSNNEKKWIEKIMELAKRQQQEKIEHAIIVADGPKQASRILNLLGQKHEQAKKSAFSSSSSSSVSDDNNSKVQEIWDASRNAIIMCVDLNAFYPSCEELREPSLKSKAHAVIMTDEKRDNITKGVVSSCSYDARKFGVRSAMPLQRAKALCPSLVLRPVDIPYYRQVSEQVMAIMERYADVIEQASIDEAFLDCSKISGGQDPAAHAMKIKDEIKERCGLLTSIGVAHTKSAAKIASDFKKPDGLTVIFPGKLRSFLAPLGVGRISGVGPKTQLALKGMGIETIGHLAQADIRRLEERFGKNGKWMWQVANGTDCEPVTPREDNVSLSTESTLDEFTKDREKVMQYLNESMAEEICERIKKHGYQFRTIGVKIVRTDFSIETREISLAKPMSDKKSILSAIPKLVARLSIDGGSLAIRKVGLKVTNLERIGTVMQEKRKADEIQPVQRQLTDYY